MKEKKDVVSAGSHMHGRLLVDFLKSYSAFYKEKPSYSVCVNTCQIYNKKLFLENSESNNCVPFSSCIKQKDK